MLQFWQTYQGVDLARQASGAYTYVTSRVELDADGAPNAYGPADIGLDALKNPLGATPCRFDPGRPHQLWIRQFVHCHRNSKAKVSDAGHHTPPKEID
jgi:hypothetical protein